MLNELPAVQTSTSSLDMSYGLVYPIAESLVIWKYKPMDVSTQTADRGVVDSGCGRLEEPVLAVQTSPGVAESYRYSTILPDWLMT